MKERLKPFKQYLYHDVFGEKDSQKYLYKLLPVVGEIVMNFNGLEGELDTKICNILHERTDSFGLIVINKMNYSSKVDLFKRLTDHLFENTEIEISSYGKVFCSLKECGRLRNLAIHADWENTDIDRFTYVKLKINKDGMKQEYVQFSENSLNDINDLIFKTRAELQLFWEDLNEKLSQIN